MIETIKKANLIKINKRLITCLILAQPFIVMFQATVVRDVQLFGFSVFEFFNIISACVAMVLSVITSTNKKQFIKYIGFILLLGIYTIMHGWNLYQFDHSIYTLQQPNFVVESYYIFRTFIIPLLLIFDIYYAHFTKEEILCILEKFITIISLVMVITNIFYIAQRTYGDATIYNSYSIFNWFTFPNVYEYSYYELTTKGWFLSGNQMSSILFMSYPVILWRAYDKRDRFHYLLVILQSMAMYMLGTKTANMGCLLILIMFIILWAFFKIIKKAEKGILFFIVVLICFGALFPFSPVGYKMRYDKDNMEVINGSLLDQAMDAQMEEGSQIDYEKLIRDSRHFKTLKADALSLEDKQFVLAYMDEFCSFFGISPFIIEHYHDLDHSEFWTHYIQETPNNDYRVLKTMILKDIYKKNDHFADRYLGMGYTLNYIYTEADYSYQYYSYGIIGILILIGPYYLLLGYVLFCGLKKFKEMFTMECAVYFIAPVLGLLIAKFSGHVLERAFPLMSMGVMISILLLHTKQVVETTFDNVNQEQTLAKLEVPDSETLQSLWKVQVEILDEVVRICEKYQLKYYLIYGTLIGAIRHKGFIPWDDDLDIGMPRKDYEKFLEVAPVELGEQFFLQTAESNKGYWLVFAKVRKNHTLFLENAMANTSSCVHKGIFIDIFPQDYVNKNHGLSLHIRFILSKALIETMYVKAGVFESDKVKYWYLHWLLQCFSLEKLWKMQRYVAMFHGKTTDQYLTDFNTSRPYLSMIFPHEHYEPSKQWEFCHKMYSIPNNYDALLTAIYGEYMVLPKEEDRLNHNTTKIVFDTTQEPDFNDDL